MAELEAEHRVDDALSDGNFSLWYRSFEGISECTKLIKFDGEKIKEVDIKQITNLE